VPARVTHDGTVFGVAFSSDGRLLATASTDNTARVWEVASSQERSRVTHTLTVRGVAFSPDGRWLATASDDHSARVWALVR
jgi:WD40 repeat protein